jgi:hypothetical protein
MPAPSDSPEFATAATFTVDGDTWGGDATTADPGAPRRAEGFEPTTLPVEWINWILNNHGAWLAWLGETDVARTMRAWAFGSGTNWTRSGQRYTSSANAATLQIPIPALPPGASIVGITVWVDPGAARGSGSRVSALIQRQTPSTDTTSSMVSGEDDGTAVRHSFDVDLASPELVDPADAWFVTITSGNDGGAHSSDAILAVIVNYTTRRVSD